MKNPNEKIDPEGSVSNEGKLPLIPFTAFMASVIPLSFAVMFVTGVASPFILLAFMLISFIWACDLGKGDLSRRDISCSLFFCAGINMLLFTLTLPGFFDYLTENQGFGLMGMR